MLEDVKANVKSHFSETEHLEYLDLFFNDLGNVLKHHDDFLPSSEHVRVLYRTNLQSTVSKLQVRIMGIVTMIEMRLWKLVNSFLLSLSYVDDQLLILSARSFIENTAVLCSVAKQVLTMINSEERKECTEAYRRIVSLERDWRVEFDLTQFELKKTKSRYSRSVETIISNDAVVVEKLFWKMIAGYHGISYEDYKTDRLTIHGHYMMLSECIHPNPIAMLEDVMKEQNYNLMQIFEVSKLGKMHRIFIAIKAFKQSHELYVAVRRGVEGDINSFGERLWEMAVVSTEMELKNLALDIESFVIRAE